jgi:hypothetical protein
MWPSAWPARPETVRQSTPPATSCVTMKWRRSWRRHLTPVGGPAAGTDGRCHRGQSGPTRRARRRTRRRRATGQGALGLGDPPRAQQLDRAGAHGNPALSVGLGVLVHQRLLGGRGPRCRRSTLARSKSMSGQRSAHSSPRRAPSMTARRRNMPNSGSSAIAADRSRAAWSACGGCTSAFWTDGAVASLAGLWPIQPQTTACLRAPDSTAWTSWTVLALSGRPSLPPRVRSWV